MNDLERMKVRVKYTGKDDTLVRPYPNLPKIPVASGETVEVDATVAAVLRRLPTWSIVGEAQKLNANEEAELQTKIE